MEGSGLTWNDGLPRVEGYSNLLWLLAVAGLGALGLDLILAARLLGLACLAGVLALLTWRSGKGSERPAWQHLLPGLLLFALAAPVAAWAIGGLEQPLVALLLALAIPLCYRLMESERPRAHTALAASLALGLLCLTRPDGPLFTMGALLAALLARRLAGRRMHARVLLLLACFPLLCSAGQLAFRVQYYGAWVPNTALVKLHFSIHHLLGGLKYVVHGLLALAPLSLAALLWLGRAGLARNPRALLLLVLTALWLGYVAVVGGDFFAAFRFFLPVLVFFSFALVEAAREHGGRLAAWGRSRRYTAGAVVTTGLTLFLLLQRYDSGSRHAAGEDWEWQGRAIALALRASFAAERPLLAVTAAGCLPYWSGLPCLDMLGLNDHYLPRHPPRDIGQGALAHELGSADYVLSRRPDIVCFHVGERVATFPSGLEMQARPEFQAAYVAVPLRLEAPRPFTATLWFRRDSPLVGLRVRGGEIRVPGHLLTAEPGTLVRSHAGRLMAVLTAACPAGILLDGVDENWSALVHSRPRGAVRAVLRQEGARTRVTLRTEQAEPILVEELLLTRGPAATH